MMIIEELSTKISAKRDNEASFKELAFFDYLNEQDTKLLPQEGSSEMDQICYAAFFSHNERVLKLAEKERKTTPVKGLHYSKNLIELIAMAKLDFINEEKNLYQYLSETTLKDAFLINRVFPEIEIPKECQILDAVDKLVEKAFLKEEYENIGEFALNAISGATDLIDLYVVKASIAKTWDLHPDRHLERDILKFIHVNKSIKRLIENKIRRSYDIGVTVALFVIISFIFFFIPKYWEDKNLEPLFVALDYTIRILIAIIPVILVNTVPRLKKIYDDFIKKRVDIKYFDITGQIKSRLDVIEDKYSNDYSS